MQSEPNQPGEPKKLSILDLPSLTELEDCIRCAACLPVCPTYRINGVEGDSPRGRVALVKAQVEGKVDPLGAVFTDHMDTCLQCMACYTVCPTGVNAGAIVARQKSHAHATQARTRLQRIADAVMYKGFFPHYRWLEIAALPLRFYRWSRLQWLVRASHLLRLLPQTIQTMEGLLPERLGPPALGRIERHTTPPKDVDGNGRVAFHVCCINNIMFPNATEASVRVLAQNGYDVATPRDVTCCGAPHETAGLMETGRDLARRNMMMYEKLDVDYIVTDSAACGASLKAYGEWFAHDSDWHDRAERFSARVRDIHELLLENQWKAPGQSLSARITYDDPCHLCHAQGVSSQPRQLLQSIPGIDYVELEEASWCCGSAGTYNVTQPDMAGQILREKIEHIRATGASIVASANPGCMLQLEAGLKQYGVDAKVRHVTELLDEAYGQKT